MSLIAVSDLHILDSEDPLYSSLLTLLDQRVFPGDTVVLAGDLFDTFVGDKSIFTQRYSRFLEVLEKVGKRGATVHYIEGNHDFLLKRAFKSVQGVQTHPEKVILELSGKRFHFTHGDLVDQKDYGYRILRFLLRSPLMKALVAILPGEWLEKIGKLSSQKSRQYHGQLPHHQIEPLRKLYRNYAAEKLAQGCDFVVMGHCHDLDEMSFILGNRKGQYVNIGLPRVHGSYLSWSPGEEKIQREKLP